MPRFWRTVLFAIFAIGFLISAPLVVFYTAGYRYQFGSMRVVKAGVVSVTSIPKGANVSINGIPSEKKTPTVIDNVFPGNISILIEKAGYSSWKKTLPVLSGTTTFVPNAVLYLQDAPTPLIDKQEVMTLAAHEDSRIAYLLKNNESFELWIKDDSFLQNRLIHKQTLHEQSTYTLSWSKDGVYLLIKEASKKNTWTIVRASDGLLMELPTPIILDAWWNEESGHRLVYRTEKFLHLFDLETKISFPKNIHAQDILAKQNSLFVIQPLEKITLSKLDDQGLSSVIHYLPSGNYKFIQAPSPYLMLQDKTQERIILLNPEKQNPLIFEKKIRSFDWSPKNDQLVYTDGFDIGLFSLSSEQSETITRLSDPIHKLHWYPIGDEILYQTTSSIFATELDRRDVRNTIELINGYNIQTMWGSKNGESLFFLGQKGGEAATIFERKLQK